jgi:hypothetical protein
VNKAIAAKSVISRRKGSIYAVEYIIEEKRRGEKRREKKAKAL